MIKFVTANKKIITDTILVSGRYAIVSLIGLLLSIAFARLATPETMGQYQFILSLIAIFSVFTLPGLNIAALSSVAQGNFGAVRQAVKLSFFGSLVAVPILVGYGIYQFIKEGQWSEVALAAIIFGVIYPFLYSPNTWYVFYEGRLLFGKVAAKVIVSTLLSSAFVYVGLLLHLSALWLAFIWLVTAALFSWFFYWRMSSEAGKELPPGNLDVSYGMFLSAQKFIFSLTDTLPVFIISTFIGFAGVAKYQIASGFLIAIVGLITAALSISLPIIFSESNRKSERTLFFHSILMGALGSIGYVLIVKLLFLAFYGELYRESYEIALTLWMLPFLISLRVFCVNMLMTLKRIKIIIGGYVMANLAGALLLWYYLETLPFVKSAAGYLYSINVILLLFFLTSYFFIASKKTRSI